MINPMKATLGPTPSAISRIRYLNHFASCLLIFFNSPGVPPDCEHHFYTFGTPKTETATSTPHPGRFMRELSEWHASRHDLPVEGDPNLGRCQVGEKRRLFVSDKCPYFFLPKANVIDDDDL